jgi:hypothetical protein
MVEILFSFFFCPKKENIRHKKWQATHIAPLNHLPLLRSRPGGFNRSWSYETCRCKCSQSMHIAKQKLKKD